MYLLIVTGLSGAGKSMVLRHLEDRGFFCVDNLPSLMLGRFTQLCQQNDPPIDRAAVVIDSRENMFHSHSKQVLELIDSIDAEYEVLFLDCHDSVLQRRYNETRRQHPLAVAGDIAAGIAREREYLQFLRDRANYILDTSELKPNSLGPMIDNALSLGTSPSGMSIVFMSFGYKRGVPIDADFVFDMRFIANPYYEPSMRMLSGQDEAVRNFVLSKENVNVFFDQTEKLLRMLLPGFIAQSKPRLLVAFGCTGGRHRSVVAAEEMYRRFSGSDMRLRLFHRDISAEGGQ